MGKHDPWNVASAVMGVSRRVLMYGPPGTGKTFHAVNAGWEDQETAGTVYQVTMTDETPAAELRGHYIAKGSEWVWADGPAVKAWREGARFVINEIDRASEDALSFLYVIMDDPEFAHTTLPTGEVIKPKDGFQVIATMNGVPEDLPEALQDRFPVDIHIQDVHPKAIEQLPEDLRGPAKNTTLAREGGRRLSIRSWLEYAKLRTSFDDEMMAAKAIFGDRAEEALLALKVSKSASADYDLAGGEITTAGAKGFGWVMDWADKIGEGKATEEDFRDWFWKVKDANPHKAKLDWAWSAEADAKTKESVIILRDGTRHHLSKYRSK